MTEARVQSPKRRVFNKARTMDNVKEFITLTIRRRHKLSHSVDTVFPRLLNTLIETYRDDW
jgi:hypothetical protein